MTGFKEGARGGTMGSPATNIQSIAAAQRRR